jgi:hypothetical protein
MGGVAMDEGKQLEAGGSEDGADDADRDGNAPPPAAPTPPIASRTHTAPAATATSIVSASVSANFETLSQLHKMLLFCCKENGILAYGNVVCAVSKLTAAASCKLDRAAREDDAVSGGGGGMKAGGPVHLLPVKKRGQRGVTALQPSGKRDGAMNAHCEHAA